MSAKCFFFWGFLGELVKFNLLDLLHVLKNRIQVARLIIMMFGYSVRK